MNGNLCAAKRAKNDEFYTRLADIEKELRHYERHFRGKTVLCNCDDPFESNFFRYFCLNFNRLGLKKLVSTCYAGSPVAKYREGGSRPYRAVVTGVRDADGDGAVDMADVLKMFETGENELAELRGDGDFRSEECLALLEDADIVVTNPPFSLFREYVATLMEHGKKFIIIGNINAVTYKEIFPLIKNGEIWSGFSFNKTMEFCLPDSYEKWNRIDAAGRKVGKVPTIAWYTNLDIRKRHEDLILVRRYAGHEDAYPRYDNYDAIEVSRVKDIPMDYTGAMGVPISFLDKYNPDQFEIIRFRKGLDGKDLSIGGKCPYFRIIIRNRHPETLTC